MPIYEYRCPSGHTFEVFQRFADAPIEVCQECGKGPVEKILFPVAVHFKGSGFYSTDYGKGGRKKDAKEGKEGTDSKGGDSSSSSSSSDSSPSGGDKSEKASSSDKSSGGDTKKSQPSSDS
jgi:putative FmdB family regulatory protein